MLTPRLHPDVLQLLQDYPGGLMALYSAARRRRILAVKMTKEGILAAMLRKELKVYLIPIRAGGAATAGLVTAIFDDEDEPLTIWTPLVEDGQCEDLRETFLESEVDVHFFDEHGRELLGYRATLDVPATTRDFLETVEFFPATNTLIRAMWDGLPKLFGERTSEDDKAAITVSFREATVPEDIFILETRPDKNAFHGSPAVRHTKLVRPEPGKLQEWDIVDLLQRTFDPSCIYHGPLKITDGEEIADVVVVTATHVLAVQAKDSPNIERIANNALSRKRASALKNLEKALMQVRGAVRYIRSSPQLSMTCGGKNMVIPTAGKELVALVVSKELFIDQYAEYSKLISAAWTDSGVPCVAMDYMELADFAAHVVGEAPFFEVLERIHAFAQEHGQYPRSRFGLGPAEEPESGVP